MSYALVDVIEETVILETGETVVEVLEVAAQGAPGARGSVWHSGNGAPPANLGVIDDFYLNRLNSDVYKKTVTGWIFETNLSVSGAVEWANIQGKPLTFPPATHTHVALEITDFTPAAIAAITVLDGGNF